MAGNKKILLYRKSYAGKIIAAIFAFLVLLAAGLLAFTKTETFENWVKNRINEWIVENIDGKVTIGTLGYEFVPPRIFAENVTVADRNNTKFINADRIEIIPDIIAFIKEDFNFEEIAFTRPSINIVIENGKIVNLPSLKKPPKMEGKKPVLKTLSIINGEVHVKAVKSAPWDVHAYLSSINLDVTGEENIVFEVRLLTGKGNIRLGEVETDIEKIETRTTVELTDEFKKLRIKHFDFNAGEIALVMKESELAFDSERGPSVFSNFTLSSPLPVASKLHAGIPELKGYETCEGVFSYNRDKIDLDTKCSIDNLWIKNFEIGTLSSRIILKDDALQLEDCSLHGGGGILTFDASVNLKGKKEIAFDGISDGLEISRIFHQLGGRRCGVKFSGFGPLRLSGTLDPVDIQGDVDWEVKGFRVFTRDHKHPRAKEVLNIPRADVKSGLEITDRYFRFRGGQIKFQNTLVTTDTKLFFNKTMDITVKAPKFNGADVKSISRVPIKGTGTLQCKVKGKMKTPTVSGSADLSNFHFAGVNFGNVDFKLDYKGKGTILLPRVNAVKGRSKYKISDGRIMFRSRKKGGILVEGDVFAERLYISDLKKMFAIHSRILEHIEARSRGDLKIKYEPDLEQTTVSADLDLSGITLFGESFEKGNLQGEWYSDDINIQALKLSGKLGTVEIVGNKGEGDSLDFDVVLKNIKSKHLNVADFDRFGLDFTLGTTTKVRGTIDNPVVDNAVIHVWNTKLGGVRQKDTKVLLDLRNNLLTLTGDVLEDKILWKSITDINNFGTSEVVVDINDLTLDEKELGKITGEITGAKHTLNVNGTIKASATLTKKFKIEGNADFSKFNMKFSEYEVKNSAPILMGFTDKSLTFKKVMLEGEGTQIKVTGGISKKGPAVSLQGNVDLNLMKRFVGEISSAKGHVSPRLLLSGKWKKPYFLGEMGINCEMLRLKTGSLKFKNITGKMSLDHNTVIIDLGGNLSGGQFLASGTMQMESLKPVSYEVHAEFNDINIRPYKGVPIGLEGNLTLARYKKAEGLPRLSGEIWVTSLRYTKDFVLSQQMEDIVTHKRTKDVKVYDKREENLNLDITLHGTKKLSVNNNIADAYFRVDESQKPFKVIGTDILPVLYGTIVVSKGTVYWKGKSFELERGIIDFTNPVRSEAHFDILADGEIKDWKIQLHAVGTPDDFVVHMTSEPELPEEDIILLIQFGMTREEMAQIENAEAVAAEITSQAIGLDTHVKQLIPIIDQFQITTEFSKTTNKVEPRVSVGKNLTDKIKLSAVSGLTNTESLEKGTYFKAVVEYKVTDALSVQAAYDNAKGPEVGQTSQQFGNVGVDIKWRIEF